MKTLKTLSALVFAAGVLFTSCSKKDNTTTTTTTTPNNPSISLVGGTGYTSTDYTVYVGDVVKIKAISLSNGTSGSKLDHLHETVTANNVNYVDSTKTFSTSITSHADSIVAATSVAGSFRVEFTITDKAGLSASVGVNITVIGLNQINTGNSIILGGSADSHPSYLNLQTANTYSASNAAANASSIELVYNKTQAYSPTDALETNATIHAGGIITKLDLYTAKPYASITASDVNAYVPSGATNVTLGANSVVMFSTNNGKKGVFQVTAFNGSIISTTTDNITISGQILP